MEQIMSRYLAAYTLFIAEAALVWRKLLTLFVNRPQYDDYIYLLSLLYMVHYTWFNSTKYFQNSFLGKQAVISNEKKYSRLILMPEVGKYLPAFLVWVETNITQRADIDIFP